MEIQSFIYKPCHFFFICLLATLDARVIFFQGRRGRSTVDRSVLSNPEKKITLAPRVSFSLPFTVNSRLLRYFLMQTLSQRRLSWHQIGLKRRGIMKRKPHVQSFLSAWNKRLLSATKRHAGKRLLKTGQDIKGGFGAGGGGEGGRGGRASLFFSCTVLKELL